MGANETPIHLGHAEPGGKWSVDFPAVVEAWCASLAGQTGCDLAITIRDKADEKTRLQENGFHAMIRPWASGGKQDITRLKLWLLVECFGVMTYVAPSGEEITQPAEPHTSNLTKAQYSELIEHAMEVAARVGVFLTPPDEYRRIKDQERRRAERRAAKIEDA